MEKIIRTEQYVRELQLQKIEVGQMPAIRYFHSDEISNVVEKAIKEVLPSSAEVFKEHRLEQMFLVDFYIPSKRFVIEINGRGHFYPFIGRKDNPTNLKSKMLRSWSYKDPLLQGYSLLNLNTGMLSGLAKDETKLQDLIS